ncbi:MAG: UDP-N-acetylmuramate dehydrogenase [Candidatus Neomarinimicrobiota bacterium]|nr:UDP-N-acetylmuramate dehydrogenase [Candidatus Neomarinimicrobiota bacterium]
MQQLKEHIINGTNSTVLVDELMKKHTTYGIGGPAEIFVLPSNKEDLIKVFEISKEANQEINVIGSGSNLLVSDNGIKGVVICIKDCLKGLEVNNNTIYAECGVMLGKLVRESIKNNLKGLENLVGVPGTLGGALIMNAGAWGGEVSDCLKSVELLDTDNQLVTLLKSEIDFSYRSSSFKNGSILLSAIFDLTLSDENLIKNQSQIAQFGRKDTQPLNYRSAGSVFKNPSKDSPAGMLIDKAGLKGLTIGQAQISEKHANFFVNVGDAKAEEMLALIKKAKSTVKDKFDIEMNLEVKLMGFEEREIESL